MFWTVFDHYFNGKKKENLINHGSFYMRVCANFIHDIRSGGHLRWLIRGLNERKIILSNYNDVGCFYISFSHHFPSFVLTLGFLHNFATMYQIIIIYNSYKSSKAIVNELHPLFIKFKLKFSNIMGTFEWKKWEGNIFLNLIVSAYRLKILGYFISNENFDYKNCSKIFFIFFL